MKSEFSGNMKAGFQNMHDSMRAMAEHLLGKGGHAAPVYYSKSCAEKSHIRPYKSGGKVEHDKHAMHRLDHKGHPRDRLPDRKMHDGGVTKHHSRPEKDIVEPYVQGAPNAPMHRANGGHMLGKMHAGEFNMHEPYLQGQGNEPLNEKGVMHQMHHTPGEVFHELADKPMKVRKFAMGGVGKIRHEEATKDGQPLHPQKKSYKYNM